ncbi:MAG: hypothetical protein AABZ06_04690, partial [Bdellovibrionota bacterium]
TVFTFGAEMLAVLLDDSKGLEPLFFPYSSKLQVFVDWLHHNFIVGEVNGWRSNHLPPGKAEAWATASVCWALSCIHRMTQVWLTDIAVSKFGTEIKKAGL